MYKCFESRQRSSVDEICDSEYELGGVALIYYKR
jgi:hypothetical protein